MVNPGVVTPSDWRKVIKAHKEKIAAGEPTNQVSENIKEKLNELNQKVIEPVIEQKAPEPVVERPKVPPPILPANSYVNPGKRTSVSVERVRVSLATGASIVCPIPKRPVDSQ